MKKILLDNKDSTTISFSEISGYSPIFAKDKDGELRGMVRKEKDGFVLAISATHGVGWYETLRECLNTCEGYGYEFFT